MWKNPQYQAVFPVLGQFMQTDTWEEIKEKLECSITQDWMNEPLIHTQDGRCYKRAAIAEHVRRWDEKWTPRALEMLSEEMKSPFKVCNIDLSKLKVDTKHYDEIFKDLKFNYNTKIAYHQRIMEQVKVLPRPYTREVNAIVNFYSRTEQERANVVLSMITQMTMSPVLSNDEKLECMGWLMEAHKLPSILH